MEARKGQEHSLGTSRGNPPRVFLTREAARLIGVTPARVRAIARAGLFAPGRRGRLYAFSFQDLVILRTAIGLLRAKIPPRRIRAAVRQLEQQIPADRPLSGTRIYADGKRIVVRRGPVAWQPESGQTVFVFDVGTLARRAATVHPRTARRLRAAVRSPSSSDSARTWFERGLLLEADDPVEACKAYERAVELNPELADAYINLGRLVHEQGDVQGSVGLYREALRRLPKDVVAHYNLALALEDLGDINGALTHYHEVLAEDPGFADAHYNLGRLLERLGRRTQALRHLMAYKKLTDK